MRASTSAERSASASAEPWASVSFEAWPEVSVRRPDVSVRASSPAAAAIPLATPAARRCRAELRCSIPADWPTPVLPLSSPTLIPTPPHSGPWGQGMLR